MNASKATELYYYTERTNDLVTFNFTFTSSVTLTTMTYENQDMLDNSGSSSSSTQG